MKRTLRGAMSCTAIALALALGMRAQTTEMTYQGNLVVSGVPANGSFDFEFALFDSLSGGFQQSSTLTVTGVTVANGLFSVRLNFGSPTFGGADRYLEIHVRQNGGGGFTTLTPRQLITSAPYAIRSLNTLTASTLNGVTLGGLIRNSTAPFQGNFNIDGTGAANIFDAATQYNIGGSRVLSNAGSNNLFAGFGAGIANTTGLNNAFFGANAGQLNTTGSANAFFGQNAGNANTTGASNAFFGRNAGASNTTGDNNSFFGRSAGAVNTVGFNNAFFGSSAGAVNTTASSNSFFGANAGSSNTTGGSNSFFGSNAGLSNTTGFNNSFYGASAGGSNTTGANNAFFAAGGSNTTGSFNSFFGLGAGRFNTTGGNNAFFGLVAGDLNTTGGSNTFLGYSAGSANTVGSDNTMLGRNTNVGSNNLTNATAVGSLAYVTQSNSLVLGSISGENTAASDTSVGIGTTAPAAALELRRNADLSSWLNSQLRISGKTNPNMQLNLGYDTANNRGLIQAGNNGVSYTNLLINPDGGRVGIGTTNPQGALQVSGNSPVRIIGETNTLSGSESVEFMARNAQFNSDMGGMRVQRQPATGDIDTLLLAGPSGSPALERARITGNGRLGIGTSAPQDTLHVAGIARVDTLGAAGGTNLCMNGSNQIASCSSSIRYKTNIGSFNYGLEVIKKLRPITFDWKDGGAHDLGLAAEDVATIEPLLSTYNKSGQVEGVKYDRIGVVLVNAVKEQQAQIEKQVAVNKVMQAQIDELKQQIRRLTESGQKRRTHH